MGVSKGVCVLNRVERLCVREREYEQEERVCARERQSMCVSERGRACV